MEDYWRRYHIPAFGSWDFYDEVPITQYFETGGYQPATAGVVRGHLFPEEDVDLFKVPEPVTPPPLYTYDHYQYHNQCDTKPKKDCRTSKKTNSKEQIKKQGRRVCNEVDQVETAVAVVMIDSPKKHQQQQQIQNVRTAVDEDLYKIPPELLYRKSKKKQQQKKKKKRNLLGVEGLLSACLGLNCIR